MTLRREGRGAARAQDAVAVRRLRRPPAPVNASSRHRTRTSDMTQPRLFTREQVAARDHRGDAAIIIDNVVYDVTGFLEDHPGGAEVLLDNAGRDATKCFRDVGHSDDAYAWREQYVMGEVVEAERWPVEPRVAPLASARDPLSLGALVGAALPPLALAIASALLYFYLF